MPLSNLSHLKSYPSSAFKKHPSNYMTMGLRKLDAENWLTIDSEYDQYYRARQQLPSEAKEEVLQRLPGGEAACEEHLGAAIQFLVKEYPKEHEIFEGHLGQEWIRNNMTGEEFSIKMPYNLHPLEVVARLVVEDFNIMMKTIGREEWLMKTRLASATFSPAGWYLRDRIGSLVTDLWFSAAVGGVSNALSYFSRLYQKSFMERSSFFVQVRPPGESLAETSFIQEPNDFFPGNVNNLWPRDIIIKRERQTFCRLPKTNAVVFTVKTSITPLVRFPKEELRALLPRSGHGWKIL
ncbi:uncharacterized protein K441DRAFT_679084 [Cenococcum geophilum 1.58]|uniref:uncharacterized protein n=1 Tax=Cenococcum geophilum 1.58 TaxID=794803 RepID=UPI00358F4518|nr:hypothetical protein K441DRAFT_679084 [Cenococcum geophilum 1.58]